MSAIRPRMDVLTTQAAADWMQILDRCSSYDFYHLPQYHILAEERGEGAAHLFVYTEGDYTIALPLLLRCLDEITQEEGGEMFRLHMPGVQNGWRDATSVYGYAGPLCSHKEIPDSVIGNFQSALLERLRAMRVVTVFSRLNPFFNQRALLSGLGEFPVTTTVSIDLTIPAAVQYSKFRKNHKKSINKLRRLGLTVVHDQTESHLEDFNRIYHETMNRVEAADGYFLSPTYFARLRAALGSRLHLFTCLHNGRAVCAGLFVVCHGILQYHLGGTLNEALKLSPMKLQIDEVRLWAVSQGLQMFHLGGGATPHPDDSLLHFKKGFSDRQHDFAVWRWILFPDVYHRLCEAKSKWNKSRGLRADIPNFFPAYRCSTVSSVVEAPLSAEGAASPEPVGFFQERS